MVLLVGHLLFCYSALVTKMNGDINGICSQCVPLCHEPADRHKVKGKGILSHGTLV